MLIKTAATQLAALLLLATAGCSTATGHHRCESPTQRYSQYHDIVVSAAFRNADIGFTSEATITTIPEGKLTAAHVLLGITSSYQSHPKLDIAADISQDVKRPSVTYGEPLVLIGFPAGCKHPIVLDATAYVERFPGELVAVLKKGSKPIAAGMSGGAAINANGEVIGIIVTRNHALDLNNDGEKDESADIILLHSANLKPQS